MAHNAAIVLTVTVALAGGGHWGLPEIAHREFRWRTTGSTSSDKLAAGRAIAGPFLRRDLATGRRSRPSK